MRIKDTNEDDPSMNLTPMIDVVFQLLIFYMVATTFLDPEKEIDVDLPESISGEAAEKEKQELVINIFEDGRVVLSGQELSDDGLLDALKAAAQNDPDTPVTIRGDRLVRHERVVQVMDACGRAGLLNLAVGTLEGT